MTQTATTRAHDQRSLAREDWIAAARKILIEKGISGLTLRPLAESLGTTTGAFYWQYRSLEELLEEVRQDWAQRNTEPFAKALAAAGPSGMRQYLAMVRVLVLETDFDPRYDNAIRQWAHSSPRTAEILRDIENVRIEQLRGMYEALGFKGRRALIQARVNYFHQAGYNAMQISESVEERILNVPFYAEILAGRDDMSKLSTVEEIRAFILDPPAEIA